MKSVEGRSCASIWRMGQKVIANMDLMDGEDGIDSMGKKGLVKKSVSERQKARASTGRTNWIVEVIGVFSAERADKLWSIEAIGVETVRTSRGQIAFGTKTSVSETGKSYRLTTEGEMVCAPMGETIITGLATLMENILGAVNGRKKKSVGQAFEALELRGPRETFT